MRFARSSSRRRVAERPFPARLMKYWIIRIPELRPFGETSLRAIVRAMCSADPVKVRDGGWVESVVTRLTQRFVDRFLAMVSGRRGSRARRDSVRVPAAKHQQRC